MASGLPTYAKEESMADGRESGNGGTGSSEARPPGVGVLAALEGVALIVWNLIATPFIRSRRMRWGTKGTEAADPLPGDEFVADPKWSHTLGIGIDAPPEAVWPWIVQIGQGRGGFYTYPTLENMVGCKITNTTEVLPDHQHPAVGENIYLFPDAPPLRMEIVDPPNAWVLMGAPNEAGSEEVWGVSSWQFIVKPDGNGGSRFFSRSRYDYAPNWKSRLMFGRFPLEPISFVMLRKMMLEIKRLAERKF